MMQNQSSFLDPKLRFKGSFHAFRGIISAYGLAGIYNGLAITMVRDITAFAIFFGIYEVLKSKLFDSSQPQNLPLLMSLGSIAGVISWLPAYPFDICKTKIQLNCFTAPQLNSIRHTTKRIYKLEGWKGFTKGLKPCLTRTVFVSSATMGVYERTIKMLTERMEEQ
jgi:solute carrier family 25 (mitochondrial carnitine/acylcarnitine transporter), member 20/29